MGNEEQNKLIAKNTLMLYVRMFFTLSISLYTSRLVLNILGVTDFGIYNVVGGIAVILSFLNGSLINSSQRYMNVALGKGDKSFTQKIFSNILIVHAGVAFIILCLSETVGLWFLNTQLNIPEDRNYAANIIFQFSIITCVIQVFQIPFGSVVVAHEHIGTFAWLSVLDVSLKLVFVLLLSCLTCDKLIYYGAIMLLIVVVDFLIYFLYAHRKFDEVVFSFCFDSKIIKEIGRFTSWTITGSVSYVLFTQGINMLLNIFYGPAVNAARAIGVQVQGVVSSFIYNFQVAAAPQTMKTCASGDTTRFYHLIFSSSKISFFLLLIIVTPVLLETSYLLTMWLKTIPDYTVIFVRYVLVTFIFEVTANPLVDAVYATGYIKKYLLAISAINLLIVPVSYVFIKLGYPPQIVYLVYLIAVICSQISRLIIILPIIHLPFSTYYKAVLQKLFVVGLLASICPLLVHFYMEEGVIRLITETIVSLFGLSIFAFLYGSTLEEKELLLKLLRIRS